MLLSQSRTVSVTETRVVQQPQAPPNSTIQTLIQEQQTFMTQQQQFMHRSLEQQQEMMNQALQQQQQFTNSILNHLKGN